MITSNLREHPAKAGDRRPDHRAADGERTNRDDSGAGDEHLSRSTSPELITIAPRRELWPQWLADPDELRSIAEPAQPDLRRRDASPRIAVQSLGLFDRLPPLIEW